MAPDGELIALGMRHDRTGHLEFGLTNPDNVGFVPTRFFLARSTDWGRTWGDLEPIVPPLCGPEWEMCCPIVFLRDGRWLLPTSTWQDWDGRLPNGHRMVAFVSADQGRSWPRYLDVMHGPTGDVIYWESKVLELADGRLLAVAWCHDHAAQEDRPNHYALSGDGGANWSAPQSTGLSGQTLTTVELADRRLLTVYRRIDQPGLWIELARLDGDAWVHEAFHPLWGHAQASAATASGGDMVENFHKLRFGAPHIVALPQGQVFVSFWGYEDGISVIRWFRFGVQ